MPLLSTEIAVSVSGGGLPVAIQPMEESDGTRQLRPRGATGEACPCPDRLSALVTRTAQNRPYRRNVCRPAGGRQKPWPAAGRLQGSRAAAWDFTAPGACGRLAVLLHPAAGLAEGQPSACLASRPDAAGGARPL